MSTPVDEKGQYSFPAFEPDAPQAVTRPSDEDGTLHNEPPDERMDRSRFNVRPSYTHGPDSLREGPRSPMSTSQVREQSQRLGDDLEVLRAERVVSNAAASNEGSTGKSRSMARTRSCTAGEPVDDFDVDTTPIHEKTKIYQPPAHPATKISKVFKKIHNSSWVIRYFLYITPITLVLLIPLLLGAIPFSNSNVGGVRLFWFSVWLEIVWLTLWAGRILAKCLPYPIGLVASLFTNNDKKWRDMGKQLEVPATLFFWWLAIEISFLPTMINHHVDGDVSVKSWEDTVNKIIVSIFVGAVLNFIEKIIIQLIAISFHLRTYADRIEVNKFQIGSLVKLYIHSKEKIAMADSEFEIKKEAGNSSGARTPMQYINKAGKNARQALTKVGDVAGKVAGDFTGKAITQSTHPHQVILQLLSTTKGSQVLARRLYRTFAQEGSETVFADDLKAAFDNDDEADSAFAMFDKDMNGDISMEELEAVCVEIGRERKAITASLKGLDSVVSKLDDIFMFVVAVITLLVLISLISTSAQGVLTSAGSAVLALSWLFSATAQEFLQSVIFVFVKHPFDVGDRVTIYGNTGTDMKGDDYFVKEISLLFTEFKKMEGHVVQAPNNYLNSLFILNQRRSGGLAEAVPVTVKFGTTLEQIESLRNRLLEFVANENREYQKNILTELRNIYEVYSITLNVIFFYKSNWQNELLRLQRRNKFICALMITMQELGIEGPRQNLAGQSAEMPMYHSGVNPQQQNQSSDSQSSGPGPRPGFLAREQPLVPDMSSSSPQPLNTHPSVLRNQDSINRRRGESVSQMGKRIDFSLGMSSISSGADMGDVYDKPKPRIPNISPTTSGPTRNYRSSVDIDDGASLGKTTSRDSKLGKVVSETGTTRTHRSRFFSHKRSKLARADDETNLDDLESGAGFGISANFMPDIPEASGTNSASGLSGGRSRRGTETDVGSHTGGRIDPRTGIVSPQAIARDSALGGRDLFISSGPRRVMTEQVRR